MADAHRRPGALDVYYTQCVMLCMTGEEYRRALETAVGEYEELGAQRRRIDTRLSELAQTISVLSRLCGLTSTVPWGLTDACRTVLRNAGLRMTPVEIRDHLQGIGVDLSRYSSALAAVHTTLKRLNESGEVRCITAGRGKRAYIWQRPARAAALGPEIAQVVREMDSRRAKRKRKATK